MTVRTTANIDWLTITKKMDITDQSPQNIYEAKEVVLNVMSDLLWDNDWTFKFERKEGFYDWVFKIMPFGITLAVSADLQRQGVRVVVPGKACEDKFILNSLIYAAKETGWTLTRVDMAVDVFGMEYDWKIASEEAMKFCEEKGRSFTQVHGGKGSTIYLGSRHSANMVRVYDKAAEQGKDYPWVRIEGEFKGDVAKLLWQSEGYLFENVMRHMAAWLSDWKDPLVGYVMDCIDLPPLLAQIGRKTETDRETWLTTQVIAALRNLAEDDIEAAQRFVDMAAALVDAVRKM